MEANNVTTSPEELQNILEAALFAAGDPLPLSQLAAAVGLERKAAKNLLDALAAQYREARRGICLLEVDETYQMCASPLYFNQVKTLLDHRPKRPISQTLLETLAIIAYRQPVTKIMIEEIRGVSADHAVNRLVESGLVAELGRQDAPGRPVLFGTTDAFLRYFGYSSLGQLPSLEDDEQAVALLRAEAEKEVGETL